MGILEENLLNHGNLKAFPWQPLQDMAWGMMTSSSRATWKE